MRYALLDPDNIVENVILLDPENYCEEPLYGGVPAEECPKWHAPRGYRAVASETANIGQQWDGERFVQPKPDDGGGDVLADGLDAAEVRA